MSRVNPRDRNHVSVFEVNPKQATEILRRGRPLTGDELQELHPAEVYSLETFDQLTRTQADSTYILPDAVGELIFPTTFLAQTAFYFCSCYRWSIEDGEYLLKCEYICLSLATVAFDA